MKKVLLLIAILLISGCGSLFSSVFVDKYQKEQITIIKNFKI